MSRRGIGLVSLILGLSMVVTAIFLISIYEKREADAGHYSEMIMAEFNRVEPLPSMPQTLPNTQYEPVEESEPEPIPEMPTADYYGLDMLGVIRVPECGIELPVLDNWSMSILEYAPCRYSGNIYSDDLIILGHNYTTHFKPLKNVSIGAEVEFESVDGKIWRYEVDEIDSIHRNDVDKLESNHELILFTCEEYGVYRFVARCTMTQSPE